MVKFKTVSFCFCMLLCSIFLFAGCSNASQYTIYYQDGSRSNEFQIKVDSTACTDLGLNPTQIMQKISQYAKTQENYLRTHGQSSDGVKIQHGSDPNNEYTYNFSISFASFDAYCKFYGITEEDIKNTKPVIESGLYVSKYIIQKYSLIDESGKLSTSALGISIPYSTIYEDFRRNICGGSATLCDQLLNKINLSIIKCFSAENEYRSNANEVGTLKLPKGVESKTYAYYSVHCWYGTVLNPPKEILVYRNYILSNNRTAWYLTAIILTVIFGVILTIILCIKNKKEEEEIKKSDELNGRNNILAYADSMIENLNQMPESIHKNVHDRTHEIVIEAQPKTQEATSLDSPKPNEDENNTDKK